MSHLTPSAALDSLKSLAHMGPLARDEKWAAVRDHWPQACVGAVAEDPDFLTAHLPSTATVSPPLDAFRGQTKLNRPFFIAQAFAGLAIVCHQLRLVCLPGDELVSGLRDAALVWRNATNRVPAGFSLPPLLAPGNLFVPGRWGETVGFEREGGPARAAANIVDEMARESPSADLYQLRELLWYFLGLSDRVWQRTYRLKVLVDRDAEYDQNLVDLRVDCRPGTGAWIPDPAFPWLLGDGNFNSAVVQAKEYAAGHFDVDQVDIRWRLEFAGEVKGGSVFAALAATFRHCDPANDYDIDHDYAPTGTAAPCGGLGPVGGLKNKLEAAARRAETKVVVPQPNFDEAKACCPAGLTLEAAATADEVCQLVRKLGTWYPAAEDRPSDDCHGRLRPACEAILACEPGRVLVFLGSDQINATVIEGLRHDRALRREFHHLVRIVVRRRIDTGSVVWQVIDQLSSVWADNGPIPLPQADEHEDRDALRRVIGDHRALLLIVGPDDPKLAETLTGIGNKCQVVLTTDSEAVASEAMGIGATIHRHCLVTVAEMMDRGLDADVARSAIERMSALDANVDLVTWLANTDPAALNRMAPGSQGDRTAVTSILDTLDSNVGALVGSLAPLPEQVAIPIEVLADHWRVDPHEARRVAAYLSARGLVHVDEHGVAVLGLTMATIRSRLPAADLQVSREAVVNRWRGDIGGASTFVLESLPVLLQSLGWADDLADLFLDFAWLQAMVANVGVTLLLARFRLAAEDRDVTLVAHALRLSARPLARDPAQLAGQLVGHLAQTDRPKIQALVGAARAHRPDGGWLGPVAGSLAPPGGAFRGSLVHGNGITAMATNRAGSAAVSGAVDGTVRLWDLTETRPVEDLPPHRSAVRALTFSADGRVVSGDDLGEVAVSSPGNRHRHVGRAGAPVRSLATVGARVLVGRSDGAMRVWNTETGTWTSDLVGHHGAVRSIAVAADGDRVITGSDDGTLGVWDLAGGIEPRILSGHRGPVLDVALSSDGRRAVSASADTTVAIWDVLTGRMLRLLTGHSAEVNAVAITADGRVVSGSDDRTARVWDLGRGPEQAIAGPDDVVAEVSITLGGRRIDSLGLVGTAGGEVVVTSSFDGTLRLWDLASPSPPTSVLGHSRAVSAACLLADLAIGVTGGEDGAVLSWDLGTGTRRYLFGHHDGEVLALASIPAKGTVVSAGADGRILLWDARTGKLRHRLSGAGHPVIGLAVSADGRRMVSASVDGRLAVWDLRRRGTPQFLDGHDGDVLAVCVSADGSRAISGSGDSTARLWDLERRQMVGCVPHNDWVGTVAVSADGSRAISGSDDGVLQKWDVGTARPAGKAQIHRGEVTGIALTAHGEVAISCSEAREIVVWDLVTNERTELRGHLGAVRHLAVSTDGRHAMSGSVDGTVRLWDLAAHSEVACFTAEAAVTALASTGCADDPAICGDASGAVHVLRYLR